MKRHLALLVIFLAIAGFQIDEHPDYVPDKATAIKIAEAVWLPIFGERIYKELPFNARLQGDTLWIVSGTLNGPKTGYDSSTGTLTVKMGGVAAIEICKKDGRILLVEHGK